MYTFLVRWDALREEATATGADWPIAESKQALFEQFMEIAKAENVTRVAEGRTLDWLKSQVQPP